MSTLGHTASQAFQNLTEHISPLNYTGLTWWNGEGNRIRTERETELEQQLEELENFSILSFFHMINVFFLFAVEYSMD